MGKSVGTVSAWHDPAVKALEALVVVAAVAASGSSAARRPPIVLPVSIAFFDARHGVMGTQRTIETTYDGGRTWTIQYSGTGPYRIVEERRGNEVWATGPGQSLYSGNRGYAWRRQPRPPTSGAAFGAPSLGWEVKQRELPSGDRVAWISKTRDGGRSWRRVGRVCRDWSSFASISHVSPTRGWLVCAGQPGAGMQEKAIFETRNGGRSWSLRACACLGRFRRGRLSTAGYPVGIEFTPRGDGVLLQHRGTPVTITHDGGRTWTRTAGAPELDFRLDASIVSARRIYVLAGPTSERMRLLVTDDGGRTWRVLRRWGS